MSGKNLAQLTLKYGVYMQQLPQCPPATFTPATGQGYRFLTSGTPGPSDFLPLLFLPNPRTLPGSTNRCDAYGLSLFDSVANLKAKIAALGAGRKRFKSRWTHYALIALNPSHGLRGNPDSTGHFTLYEYANANLLQAVAHVGTL
jgi:hypothetical protein